MSGFRAISFFGAIHPAVALVWFGKGGFQARQERDARDGALSYLLDTNVISELRRKAPDQGVGFSQRSASTLYLSVLTLGELRKGVERLADK